MRQAIRALDPALALEEPRTFDDLIAIGLVFAFIATRLLSAHLYEISPTDPATFLSVTALLVGVAIVASYLPTRRAMRVEPMEALRLD